MKVLVTGSNGFIGSHLVEALLARGYKVRCLVRRTSDLRWVRDLDVEFAYGDLSHKDSLKEGCRDIDLVFHLAGVTKAKDKKTYYRVNHIGTLNLLETCLALNLKRFVYISSLAAAGPSRRGIPLTEKDEPRPITYYGESKLLGERAAEGFMDRIPITIIRPVVVYGPRDRDVLMFFRFVRRGIKPILGERERFVSIIHVRDLVQGIILAGESERAIGQTYFISNDEALSWLEVADIIARSLNRRTLTLKIPEVILAPVAYLSETLASLSGKPALLNRQKILEMKQRYWVCDNSKAKRELGFKPEIDIEEGIRETADWYERMGWL